MWMGTGEALTSYICVDFLFSIYASKLCCVKLFPLRIQSVCVCKYMCEGV